jgi:hypothetical protein
MGTMASLDGLALAGSVKKEDIGFRSSMGTLAPSSLFCPSAAEWREEGNSKGDEKSSPLEQQRPGLRPVTPYALLLF